MRIIRYQHPRATYLNPWSSFETELDRFFNGAVSSLLDEGPATASPGALHPRSDFFEDKDHFYLRAELPGLKKEDIRVELGEGVLTVAGTRKSFGTDGQAESSTEFSRSVSVPARVQEDQINARYEDGVLTVTLPKVEEVKPKRVAVQVK
jgi:HSP20 family protein